MKELCIVSGKGGTGKTTVSAAFASLAKSNVMADCDVDAADLHLLLSPELRRRESFIGARTSRIDYREWCGKSGIDVVGDIPFDPAVTRALVARRSVAEFDCGPVSEAVARLWEAVSRRPAEPGRSGYAIPVNGDLLFMEACPGALADSP